MNQETLLYIFVLFYIIYNNKLPIFFFCKQLLFTKEIKEKQDNSIKNNGQQSQDKPEEKYENKYLEEIRKLNKEFQFSEEEEQLRIEKAENYFNQTIQEYQEKINKQEKGILFWELKKEKYTNLSEEDFLEEKEYNISEYETNNTYYTEDYNYETKEEIIEYISKEIELLEKEKQTLFEILEKIMSKEGQIELIKKSDEVAFEFIVNKHLERLNNCYIMETTPHGNVLMIYEHSRGSFKYYSDNSIPYRYLEPVARKYVKQYKCRPIFVDMDDELKTSEEKWKKERKEKEIKEIKEEEEKEERIKNNQQIKEKKNVFAKFKNYNKDAGKVNTCAPPKNSIPNNNLIKEQENEKILLKERSNRYTYEGKFANFNFLKKIDRKIIDKKYGLSFADFKKITKIK